MLNQCDPQTAASLILVLICPVLGKPVSLEECKTDDEGKPVHEECYVALSSSLLPNGSSLNALMISSRVPLHLLEVPKIELGSCKSWDIGENLQLFGAGQGV